MECVAPVERDDPVGVSFGFLWVIPGHISSHEKRNGHADELVENGKRGQNQRNPSLHGEEVEIPCGPRVQAETVDRSDNIVQVDIVRSDPRDPVEVRQRGEDEPGEPPVADC